MLASLSDEGEVAEQLRILEVPDPVRSHQVLERLAHQLLVDLAPDDQLQRCLRRGDDLQRGEGGGRRGQCPHHPGSGGGVETLLDDVRDVADERADGEREQDRQDPARKREGHERDDEAALGEREQPKDLDPEPEHLGPRKTRRRFLRGDGSPPPDPVRG